MKFSTRLIVAGALTTLVGVIGVSATSIADNDEVTICHAAGLDGTTQYVTITINRTAAFGPAGHFNEDGTTQAGHEDDYLGACEEVATTTTVSESTTTEASTTSTSPTTTTTVETTVPPSTSSEPSTTTEAPTTTAAETTTTVAEPTTTTVAEPTTTVAFIEPPDPSVVDPAEDEPPLLLPATR